MGLFVRRAKGQTPISQIMSSPPVTVKISNPVKEAILEMKKHNRSKIIVTSDDGSKPEGLLALCRVNPEDIKKPLLRFH